VILTATTATTATKAEKQENTLPNPDILFTFATASAKPE
jgi:hypothetical protein